MVTAPFPTEQVADLQFEQLVELLCQRPGMFVSPVTFGAVCAYLNGFDAARSHGPLIGLHPWLVVRANDGNNWTWTGLARSLLPGGLECPEEQAIRELGSLLAEFFEYRRSQGITKVFQEYARWLLRRPWYTGPLRRARRDV